MTNRLSNLLTDLAESVRVEVEASNAAARCAAEHAVAAGAKLCEAKAECRYGEWLPFLARAGLSERNAQRWMQLHRAGVKSDHVSDLGLTDLRRFAAAGLRMIPVEGKAVRAIGKDDDANCGIFYWWCDGDHARYASVTTTLFKGFAMRPTRLLPVWVLGMLHQREPTRFDDYQEATIPIDEARREFAELSAAA